VKQVTTVVSNGRATQRQQRADAPIWGTSSLLRNSNSRLALAASAISATYALVGCVGWDSIEDFRCFEFCCGAALEIEAVGVVSSCRTVEGGGSGFWRKRAQIETAASVGGAVEVGTGVGGVDSSLLVLVLASARALRRTFCCLSSKSWRCGNASKSNLAEFAGLRGAENSSREEEKSVRAGVIV
jgi:hypothetical protein